MHNILSKAFYAVIITLVAVGSGLFASVLTAPDCPVTEPEAKPFVEPYGGCDEAYLYPKSKGYADCKAAGLVP